MANNLETQIELNKLVAEQNKLIAVQAKLQKGQLQVMKSLVESMQSMSGDEAAAAIKNMSAAIKEADQVLEEFSTNQEKALNGVIESGKQVSESFDDIGDKAIKIGKTSIKVGLLATAFEGLFAGSKAARGIFGSMLSVAGTLTKSFFNLGASIVSLPFKMLGALMEEASSYSGEGLRQAIEDLRKEMGDVTTNEGAAVIKTFRTMKEQGTDTGLSMYRVFGNMAERLKEMNRIATAMGNHFGNMTEEFMSHGRQIGEYTKGLGLSEEAIKAVSARAEMQGKTFREIGREMTTMAFGMGEAFGINGKLISKDISEMIKDVENFGSIGVKEMSQIAVYTRKLGIEVKDLLGVIGKFDDFEDAANSAAQLSQAFGIQVDTLGLLKEQDPAARFETLRKAFLATGKDVEKLTRQELSLLSAQSGVSQEALKLGFSQSKAGMSYEEIQKQSAATEKKQLSQAEAMEKLSMSIELMVKSGQQMQGGFFDIFIQGFSQGVKRSEPFRKMMMSLHRAMRLTLKAGRDVGRFFISTFPGVKDVMEGLMEVFKSFGKSVRGSGGFKVFGFLGDVVTDFKKFISTVKTDPKTSLRTLFKDLQKDFFGMFDKASPGGQKTLNGFSTFFKTLGNIFKFGLEYAVENGMKVLTSGIKLITELIKDPSSVLKGGKTAGMGMFGVLVDMLKPAFMAIREQWPALKKALEDLWEAAKPHVMKLWGKVTDYMRKAAISALVSRSILGGVAAGFSVLAGKVTKIGTEKLTDSLSGMFGKLSKSSNIKSSAKNFSESISAVSNAGESMGGAGKKMMKINLKSVGKNILIGIGAITATAIAMAFSYKAISSVYKAVGIKSEDAGTILKVTGAMGALFLQSALIIGASLAVGAVLLIPGAAPTALLGIAAIAGVTAAMVGSTIKIVKDINKIGLSAGIEKKVDIFTKIVGAMSSMAGALTSMASAAGSPFDGVINLFRGKNPLVEGLNAMAGVMSSMTKNVKDIITHVVVLTEGISPAQLAAGAMIGDLLQSVGGIAKSLMPPEELAPGFVDKLLGIPVLRNLSNYMMTTIDIMRDNLVPAITSMIGTISAVPIIDKEKIETFTGFMSGITSLMQSLQPTSGMLDLIKSSESNSLWSQIVPWADEQKGSKGATDSISAVMTTMIDSMVGPNGIIEKIKVLMGGIVSSVKELGDPAMVKSASELFSSVINSVVSVSSLFTPEKLEALNKATSSENAGMLLSKFNTNVMMPMSRDLPALLQTFDSIGGNVGMLKTSFAEKIGGGIKDMVATINSVSDSLSNIGVVNINTKLKKVADTLGIKQSEEIKIRVNDINLTINLGVTLDADGVEKALIGRPKSKFVIKGNT